MNYLTLILITASVCTLALGEQGGLAVAADGNEYVKAAPRTTIPSPTPTMAKEYLNTWLVAGTFDNDAANRGFVRDWIGETTVTPREGQRSGGRTWRYFDDRLFSRNYDDYQDLYSYFKIKQGQSIAAKVVYAHVYAYTPTAVKAELRVGDDNEFKAWLNGVLVGESIQGHPRRDAVRLPVSLAAGWNRLLIKVANQEEGRLGFYARLCDDQGESLKGLTLSVNGPDGKLAVSTREMPEAKTGVLPAGFREWPYVGAMPQLDQIKSPPGSDGALDQFMFTPEIMMQAANLALQAQGGTPPYRWIFRDGELPPGLKLRADGQFTGTIAGYAALKDYAFSVRVRDAKGDQAEKRLTITVRERPNKWVEERRLTALIHGPECLPDGQHDAFAKLMKAQGYGLAMPITYNNGDLRFRWPGRYATQTKTADDVVAKYKTAFEANGIPFGMYMGNLNVGDPQFTVNQSLPMLNEALVNYHPRALWFDWTGVDGESLDALYSMIRSQEPDLVIILNGHIRGNNGDWDIVSFEGFCWDKQAWEVWPVNIPWPKAHASEAWRLLVQPEWELSKGLSSDWQEYLRIQLSLIGEGFIANLDHTVMLGTTEKVKDFRDTHLTQCHQKMADWANPKGLEPLYHAYTNVYPGPLKNAFWGYSTLNLARDTIYLHILHNARGKTGLPADPSLTVWPIREKVRRITCMNTGREITFEQRGTNSDPTVTLDIRGLQADPVDTIFKIELAAPLPDPVRTPPRAAKKTDNLALNKPARLLSADGTRTPMASARQVAYKGVDGNLDSSAAAAEWAWTYEVDLEQVTLIDRIVVIFRPDGFATQYNLLVSDDGETWKTVAHATTNRGGVHEHRLTPVEAQFVRVQAVSPDAPGQPGIQMSIAELQIFAAR
jgi:hypothetical protein